MLRSMARVVETGPEKYSEDFETDQKFFTGGKPIPSAIVPCAGVWEVNTKNASSFTLISSLISIHVHFYIVIYLHSNACL
jgi:hypothetical protein